MLVAINVTTNICAEFQVLVIYTGGRIGMTRNPGSGALEPAPHAMEILIRQNNTMHDEEYSRMRFVHLAKMDSMFQIDEESGEQCDEVLVPLVLPQVPEHRRVIYAIYEYNPLLDSSNMTMVISS